MAKEWNTADNIQNIPIKICIYIYFISFVVVILLSNGASLSTIVTLPEICKKKNEESSCHVYKLKWYDCDIITLCKA